MKKIYITLILFFISSAFLQGCAFNAANLKQYQQTIALAEVKFQVSLPTGTNMSTGIFLEALDEVTGLGLNPTRYQMQTSDGLTYSVGLSLPKGYIFKYRYVREGNPPSIEYNSQNHQIRYRMAVINTPIAIHDQVASWQDTPFKGDTGLVQGFIFNQENSEPVSNAMVVIAGMRAFTGADGAFVISNVPTGEQYLSAIHINGLFNGFQQKAIIAANAVTPANFGMHPCRLVDITFIASPPPENLAGAPIRLFGNLLSMGNSFSDLRGGITSQAVNGVVLQYREDGTYAITLSLPAGYPLEYKYSLGDGFWNAERDSSGNFKIRKVIIPSENTTIKDIITTWRNSGESPLTFHVSVPIDTPSGSSVQMQLNPFVWMEPLPLWNLGNNQWLFTLYGPMEFVKSSTFKVILQDANQVRIDVMTADPSSPGLSFTPTIADINYSVQQWTSK
jgi:hypothetical protein